MKSLAPKDYHQLPKLDAPAGYIVVLRHIDRDAYRFDRSDHPATYVDGLLAELTGNYGIELLSILETDDLAMSESQLFDAHHARLSDEWIHLDNHQMATLRQSDLQINAHRSLYLRPQSNPPPQSDASSGFRSRNKGPAASYSRASAQRTRLEPVRDILYRLKEYVLDYMLLWLFVLFVLTIALLVLLALGLSFGDGPIGFYWR